MVQNMQIGDIFKTIIGTYEKIRHPVSRFRIEHQLGGRFVTESGKVYSAEGKAIIPHSGPLLVERVDQFIVNPAVVRVSDFIQESGASLSNLEDDFELQAGYYYANTMGLIVLIRDKLEDIGSGPMFVDNFGYMYRPNGTPVWNPQTNESSDSLYNIRHNVSGYSLIKNTLQTMGDKKRELDQEQKLNLFLEETVSFLTDHRKYVAEIKAAEQNAQLRNIELQAEIVKLSIFIRENGLEDKYLSQ